MIFLSVRDTGTLKCRQFNFGGAPATVHRSVLPFSPELTFGVLNLEDGDGAGELIRREAQILNFGL